MEVFSTHLKSRKSKFTKHHASGIHVRFLQGIHIGYIPYANPSFNPRKTKRPHLFFSILRSAPDGPPGFGSGNVSNDSESAMLRATRCRKFKGMVESGKVHQTERNFTPQKCTQVGGEGATSCVFGTFFFDGVLKPTILVYCYSVIYLNLGMEFSNGFVT